MYLIVNYGSCDRYPEEFTSYDRAIKKFNELRGFYDTLEYYGKGYRRKILIGKRKKYYKKRNRK